MKNTTAVESIMPSKPGTFSGRCNTLNRNNWLYQVGIYLNVVSLEVQSYWSIILQKYVCQPIAELQ